jgi:hypothetical protein
MKTFAAAPRRQPVGLSNATLAQDFLDLSFALESGRQLPVFTRFEGPVAVRLTGAPPASARSDLALLIARLRTEAGIDIAQTESADAQISVEAVPRAQIKRLLPEAACFVAPNVSSLSEYRRARRSNRTNWTLVDARQKVAIFIPNDVSPQEARDCLHEELAQALGPLNDLYRLPNSVFNDDNVHTVLTDFDMLMLRVTYAPELTSGMSRDAVAEALPAILARLNPGGAWGSGDRIDRTPRAWIDAIETALGPRAGPLSRKSAADRALAIAKERGWTDQRRGFSHYARARLMQGYDLEGAKAEYLEADRFFAQSTQTRLHRAYVATQLAAFALAEGLPEEALARTAAALPAARAAQNAALLATLQLMQAEALDALGRPDEAAALRLDSLGWARYGFGSDRTVRLKLGEIAALNAHGAPV